MPAGSAVGLTRLTIRVDRTPGPAQPAPLATTPLLRSCAAASYRAKLPLNSSPPAMPPNSSASRPSPGSASPKRARASRRTCAPAWPATTTALPGGCSARSGWIRRSSSSARFRTGSQMCLAGGLWGERPGLPRSAAGPAGGHREGAARVAPGPPGGKTAGGGVPMKKYRWGWRSERAWQARVAPDRPSPASPRGPPPALRRERLHAGTVGRSQSFRIVI